MQRPNLLIFALVILLLNAGISIALINNIHGSVTDKDSFFTKKEQRQKVNDGVSASRKTPLLKQLN